jgi:hypothetical protein
VNPKNLHGYGTAGLPSKRGLGIRGGVDAGSRPLTPRGVWCVRCLVSAVSAGPAGTFLIVEGPEGELEDRELFFVLDGEVRIEVRGSRVAKLGWVRGGANGGETL